MYVHTHTHVLVFVSPSLVSPSFRGVNHFNGGFHSYLKYSNQRLSISTVASNRFFQRDAVALTNASPVLEDEERITFHGTLRERGRENCHWCVALVSLSDFLGTYLVYPTYIIYILYVRHEHGYDL